MEPKDESTLTKNLISLKDLLIKDPRLFRLKILVLLSMVLGCITIVYDNLWFSCQLYILQNVVLVYIITLMLLFTSMVLDRTKRIKLGVSIAAILGAVFAGVTLLINIIKYYFLGFRNLAFSAGNLQTPKLTVQLILVGLASQLILWLMLVMASMFVGFVASITPAPARKKPT